MLKLTKKADYGLIALKHLAELGPKGSCSAKDIAEAYHIPAEALAKILQKLTKAKLLVSHHGTYGGYVLAREARQISALEVIRAIDGPLFIASCLPHHGGGCDQSGCCTIREPLRQVNESIRALLDDIKISDMRDSRRARAAVSSDSMEELVTLR
jgi:Rrf2 family protein